MNQEILGDINFLGRQEALGGISAGEVPIGDGKFVNVLIMPAREPLPVTCQLPNGLMKFLVLTVITDAKMEYRTENGCSALLDLLFEKGDGQLSELNRKSVV